MDYLVKMHQNKSSHFHKVGEIEKHNKIFLKTQKQWKPKNKQSVKTALFAWGQRSCQATVNTKHRKKHVNRWVIDRKNNSR